jgi:large subunit ribosomal protein L21
MDWWNFRGTCGEVKIGEKAMKFAIVEDGGKQYRAVEGGFIEVDRFPSEVGEGIDLDRVLLIADDDNTLVGAPAIAGAVVQATVVDHIKGPKVVVFKYKPKKRIRVKTGHRQQYTRLRIDTILTQQTEQVEQEAKEE